MPDGSADMDSLRRRTRPHRRRFLRPERASRQRGTTLLTALAPDVEHLLHIVLETLPIGVWIMNAQGQISYGNPAARAIWAGARYVGPEQFGAYKGWWLSTGAPIAADEWAAARAIATGAVSINEEIMIECFDGTRKTILNSAMPFYDDHQQVRGAIIVNQDITALMNAERALATQEAQLRHLSAILPVGVCILDDQRRVIEMNPALELILRMSQADVAAGVYSQRRYLHPDLTPIARAEFPSIRAIDEQRSVEDMEIGVVLESGEIIWTMVSAAPIPAAHRRAVIVTTDITDRKRTEMDLRIAHDALAASNRELAKSLAREQALARTDALTGVANRRQVEDLASHAIAVAKRYAQPLAVIVFDLDRFKQINDTWGHACGDQVLQHVVALAQAGLRETDLLARYGGEEFVVLLPSSDAQEAFIVAERIRLAVATFPLTTTHGAISVTMSLGIATLLGDHDDLTQLMDRADQALYRAKAAGRNCSIRDQTQSLPSPATS
jgi:diguanylate cyclase (GGDEF)-like protein/PAS domain S-box-containing protein